MITKNCPVCGQAGLPDYHKKPLVCPQCNSDLKPYMLVRSIQGSKERNRIGFILIVLFMLGLIVVTGFELKRNKSYKNEVAMQKNNQLILNDSIEKLTDKIASSDKFLLEPIIKYKVRKGDYTWKLAEFFYGDGKKHTMIEKDNNLIQPYTLRVGQILIIKLSGE